MQCLYLVVCEKIFDLHCITLLASTRQASASCTLALSRSVAFIRDPLIIVHDEDGREVLSSVDPHLEILDPGVLPLQQTLELEVWLGAVKEDDIHIHIVPVLVQEIRQEHGD